MENIKNIIVSSIVCLVVGILIGMLLFSKCSSANVPPEAEVKWDTVIVEKPVPVETKVVKRDTIAKLIHDTVKITESITAHVKDDSIYIDVKRVQKKYQKDSSYIAWVSGIDPALDSIQIFNKTTIVNKRLSGYRAGIFIEGSGAYMQTAVVDVRAGLHWTIPQGVDFFIDYRVEAKPMLNNQYSHGPEAGLRYTFDFLK